VVTQELVFMMLSLLVEVEMKRKISSIQVPMVSSVQEVKTSPSTELNSTTSTGVILGAERLPP